MARKSDCPPCPPCNPAPPPGRPARVRPAAAAPANAKPFQPAAFSTPTKGPAVQTESIQHGAIVPVPNLPLKGCCTKPPGTSSCSSPPRVGQVDLAFPSRKDAEALGVPLGPALQFCTGTHVGKVVPVKDPLTARRIAQAYTACVEKGTKVEACIAKTKGLGALASPRRKPVTRRGLRRASRLVRKMTSRRRRR